LDYQATREDDAMPTNEEGEFELVLGNKQLLSVFFVAVLLLGVFFIMGYIVGRNLSPEPALVAENRTPSTINVDPPVPTTTPGVEKPSASVRPPEPDKPSVMLPVTTPESKPIPVTRPIEPPQKAETKPVEPPKKAEAKPFEPPKKAETKPVEAPKKAEAKPVEPPKKAEVKPVEAPKKAETKPVPAPKPVETTAKPPSGGGYVLQVAAAAPSKVDEFIKRLAAKGFKATTQPVPGSDLVRIMVGPFDANGATDEAAKLKAAGFDSIRKKA